MLSVEKSAIIYKIKLLQHVDVLPHAWGKTATGSTGPLRPAAEELQAGVTLAGTAAEELPAGVT